jgi:hypothetical protein
MVVRVLICFELTSLFIYYYRNVGHDGNEPTVVRSAPTIQLRHNKKINQSIKSCFEGLRGSSYFLKSKSANDNNENDNNQKNADTQPRGA